jgi:hypothetical protein
MYCVVPYVRGVENINYFVLSSFNRGFRILSGSVKPEIIQFLIV